jgi:hypothetical protein
MREHGVRENPRPRQGRKCQPPKTAGRVPLNPNRGAPGQSLLENYGGRVRGSNSPLTKVNDVLFVAGHIVGTLNKELLVTPLEDEAEILIVVPHSLKAFDVSAMTRQISTNVPQTP